MLGLLQMSAICQSGQFEFDSVINWKARGSDGQKRGAL